MFEHVKPTKKAIDLFVEGKLGQIKIKGELYVPRCTLEMSHIDDVTLVKIRNENYKVIAKTVDRDWPKTWVPHVVVEIAFKITIYSI